MLQILLQNQIPFDFIFPEQLSERLKKYDVLVLSDFAALSEKECEIIRDFVKKRRGLYASGKSSLCNERFLLRKNYGLSDVLEFLMKSASYTRQNCGIVNCGRGKAAFMPEVIERVKFL